MIGLKFLLIGTLDCSSSLHRSQKEVETAQDYAIFSYRLRPTDDFLCAVLALGGDVEVLEPAWFRDYVVAELKRMLGRYGRM